MNDSSFGHISDVLHELQIPTDLHQCIWDYQKLLRFPGKYKGEYYTYDDRKQTLLLQRTPPDKSIEGPVLEFVYYFWHMYDTQDAYRTRYETHDFWLNQIAFPEGWVVYLNDSNPYVGEEPNTKNDVPFIPKNMLDLCQNGISKIKDERICVSVHKSRKFVRIWFSWKN